MDRAQPYDVAIIGGGPGGSTTGAFLKQYNPALSVLILEREKFPRDHIGESQLPPISMILDEMGCWDKIEAANFPIKIGATFCWGTNPELWNFEFLPPESFKDEPRPARFQGQRLMTAFQVDRSIYDDILLRHAEERGCEVHEETAVTEVRRDGDRVTGLGLRNGQVVTARHYVDASGHAGILRRSMGVGSTVPTKLMNVAVWDYWQNAEWAVEIGVGGTRIQVMSVGFGWLWFIPLGPTRTSLGLVMPMEFYKSLKRPIDELYYETVRGHEIIGPLVRNATASGKVQTTKDWSFLSDRTYGENWFLVGESAGFADPILSAGLTLTHTGARELAYTILELERGELDPQWMKDHYNANQRARVHQHIRFADFWYATNGQLTDLQQHCAEIAEEAGLKLSPGAAWAWLAQGGFACDVLGGAGIGGVSLLSLKGIVQRFLQRELTLEASQCNVFELDLVGAREEPVPIYHGGRIARAKSYVRGEHRLIEWGIFEIMISVLKETSDIGTIQARVLAIMKAIVPAGTADTEQVLAFVLQETLHILEIMVSEGWVRASTVRGSARRPLAPPRVAEIHDLADPLAKQS